MPSITGTTCTRIPEKEPHVGPCLESDAVLNQCSVYCITKLHSLLSQLTPSLLPLPILQPPFFSLLIFREMAMHFFGGVVYQLQRPLHRHPPRARSTARRQRSPMGNYPDLVSAQPLRSLLTFLEKHSGTVCNNQLNLSL